MNTTFRSLETEQKYQTRGEASCWTFFVRFLYFWVLFYASWCTFCHVSMVGPSRI